MSYWTQFSYQEIVETHGVEFYNFIKTDEGEFEIEKEEIEEEFYCNRCKDCGCYMCDLN